jgi:chemotaxis receptor (MCP) glutamine deamidase CheD
MKAYIKDLRQRCKQSELDSDEALKKLIEMTTKVEKLKAKLGFGGSLATLMQMHDVDLSNQDYIADTKLLNDGQSVRFRR